MNVPARRRRISFVGHAFHERTRSTAFFREVLNELGDVTDFASSPDGDRTADDEIVSAYLARRDDLWVFLQTEYVAQRLVPLGLRNAVIVPMYDSVWTYPDDFFRQLVTCRFITFSRTLHARLQELDLNTASFEYWPEPEAPVDRSFAAQDWSAFYWERRPLDVPNARIVVQQCKRLGIKRLHVHAVPDVPGEGAGPLGYRFRGEMDGVEVTTSTWFDDPAEFRRVSTAPVFHFAPRPREGIGMTMLEAMAAGQVVVAPDRPTMNEYVGHLASGIIYDPRKPYDLPSLSEARVRELSDGARARVAFGRPEWEADRERLKSVILGDGRRWASADVSAHFVNTLQRTARRRMVER